MWRSQAIQAAVVGTRGYGLLLACGTLGGLVNVRIVAWIGALPALLTALVANVFIFAGIGVSPDALLIPLGALTGGLVAHEFGLRAGYPIAGGLRGLALLFALPALTGAGARASGRPARPRGRN